MKLIEPKITAHYDKLFKEQDLDLLKRDAKTLGLNPAAWASLGSVWSEKKKAWMIPMYNADGEIAGFRFRAMTGKKWSLTGGHDGLFIPDFAPQKVACICEGPTDCAALISMGFFAIGRASALSGIDMVVEYFVRVRVIKRIIIIADKDEAGIKGAERLKGKFGDLSRIFTPETKDIREWYIQGGTKEKLLKAIK